MNPYDSGDIYESQWPVQILRGCENMLAGESGLTMRFLNSVCPGRSDMSTADAVALLLDEDVDAIIVIGGQRTVPWSGLPA